MGKWVGRPIGMAMSIMRRNLPETPAFEAAQEVVKRTSSLRALMKYPREVLLVVGQCLNVFCFSFVSGRPANAIESSRWGGLRTFSLKGSGGQQIQATAICSLRDFVRGGV
jgi:hypothetical protein